MNSTLNTLPDVFEYATNITISKNGTEYSYFKGDDKFEILLSSLKNITKDSKDMPAFGVSLDNETKQAKLKGVWFELKFKTPLLFNDMPFEALLFQVEKDNSGFNLIRKNNGAYDGRCFYLNLDSTMKELYNLINTQIK